MWNCRKCNAEVDDGFEICWSCGTGIDGREDPDFNAENADGSEASPVIATAEALETIASPVLAEHAHVMRCHLEAAGIDVYIADEPVNGFDWLLHRRKEPIHLQVRESQAERAKAILAEIPVEEKASPAADRTGDTVERPLPETVKDRPPVPPPTPEPPRDAPLSPQEQFRLLESKLSSLMDEFDTPDWKVNPAFHPEVNAFIQSHAANAAFLKKAQSMQQNRAKYFATIRQQAKEKAEAAAREAEATAQAEAAANAPMCMEVTEEAPKPRFRFRVPRILRRLVKWTAILLILAVAAVFIAATTYRQMGEQELKEAITRIEEKDPDWRWEALQAKRAKVPDEENAALRVLAAAKLLPEKWDLQANKDNVSDLGPQERLNEMQCQQLRQLLDKHRTALLQARSLANYSTGRYPEEPGRLPTSLVPITNVSFLLSLDVTLRAHTEKTADGAMASVRAMMVLGRSIGDEPSIVPLLRRFTIRRMASRDVERLLSHGQTSDEELAAAQKLLENELKGSLLACGLRGVRTCQDEVYQWADRQGPAIVRKYDPWQAGEDKSLLFQWFEGLGIGNRLENDESNYTDNSYGYQLEHWLKMGWLLENHALALNLLTEAVALAELPVEEQVVALDEFEEKCEFKRNQARYRWGADPMEPTIKAFRIFHRSDAQLRSTIAALATERYRLAEGKWPDSLDALVPKYLVKAPIDPYDGKPLRMRKLDDGLVIYSIGPDREDNQGELDRKGGDLKGKDIGFRLWDVERRRQK